MPGSRFHGVVCSRTRVGGGVVGGGWCSGGVVGGGVVGGSVVAKESRREEVGGAPDKW